MHGWECHFARKSFRLLSVVQYNINGHVGLRNHKWASFLTDSRSAHLLINRGSFLICFTFAKSSCCTSRELGDLNRLG